MCYIKDIKIQGLEFGYSEHICIQGEVFSVFLSVHFIISIGY